MEAQRLHKVDMDMRSIQEVRPPFVKGPAAPLDKAYVRDAEQHVPSLFFFFCSIRTIDVETHTMYFERASFERRVVFSIQDKVLC
eukprot:3676617-Amphidinium_carterae.1